MTYINYLGPYIHSYDGYLMVTLQMDGNQTPVLVHKLVAFAFLDNPPKDYGRGKMQIHHKNNVKSDNGYKNLEWSTPLHNRQASVLGGHVPKGEAHPSAKLSDRDIREIRRRVKLGERAIALHSVPALSREFRISQTMVRYIRDRRSWGHVV